MSNTRLKQITLACLIISIVSIWFISKIQRSNAERLGSLTVAEAELASSKANQSFIATQLAGTDKEITPPPTLGDAYAQAITQLRASAPTHLVTVQSLSVGARQIDLKGLAIGELAEKVTIASALKRLRVIVKGRYESLPEFQVFLDGLKEKQAVLRALDVNKDQFEISVLILGV
jgi:hypothetical protein